MSKEDRMDQAFYDALFLRRELAPDIARSPPAERRLMEAFLRIDRDYTRDDFIHIMTLAYDTDDADSMVWALTALVLLRDLETNKLRAEDRAHIVTKVITMMFSEPMAAAEMRAGYPEHMHERSRLLLTNIVSRVLLEGAMHRYEELRSVGKRTYELAKGEDNGVRN